MRIYYITANNGDGSSSTEFYDSRECIDYLTDEDKCLETYMDGDGGSWSYFDAPGGITGVEVRSLEQLIKDHEDD
jgi:hypothetical protein